MIYLELASRPPQPPEDEDTGTDQKR